MEKILPKPNPQRRLLAKKLKGANPITDADWIRKITGCCEDDATYYASVYAETKAYEDFHAMAQLSRFRR